MNPGDLAIWTQHPSSLEIESDELHLWLAELHHACSEEKCDAVELERASRYASEPLRRRYLNSHIILRRIIARYLHCPASEIVLQQPTGRKPAINMPGSTPLQFSLSRSQDLCLIGIAREAQIGVDLECLLPGRYEPEMLFHALTHSECEALAAMPASQHAEVFLQTWTRKEAYAKCVGRGLSMDLTHLEVGITSHETYTKGICVGSLGAPPGWTASWASDRRIDQFRFMRF